MSRKSLGGIQTDLESRVLRPDGEPIPGLYAAGEAAGFGGGGMHGKRSLEGTFLGGCVFSGRIAARAIAEAARTLRTPESAARASGRSTLAGAVGVRLRAYAGPRPDPAAPVAHLAAGAPPDHVAVIVMENEEYADVIGSHDAPYINSLARRLRARPLDVRDHPPLASQLPRADRRLDVRDRQRLHRTARVAATSIVDQLERAGLSWKAYMEDLPHPCFTGASAGEYAKKHDPFAYYTRIADDPGQLRQDRAAGPARRRRARRRASTVHAGSRPNLCHDMHDCDVATGDRFLSGLLPPLLRALGPRGLLFLTWDEGSSDDGCCRLASGGHIVTILAGATGPAGRPADAPRPTTTRCCRRSRTCSASAAARRRVRVHAVAAATARDQRALITRPVTLRAMRREGARCATIFAASWRC